ncbi:MAG: efflux RND transporter periplasmic adaptor subunit [Planctomycetes bacterium]|nr:efflux RND transporter periplasmic adaptor subunit [Planctomycetota bacterium]
MTRSDKASFGFLRDLRVGFCLLLLALTAACGQGGGDNSRKWGGGDQPVERKDPIVEVLPARKGVIAQLERSTGRIEAHDTAQVYARLHEVALNVHKDVGDFVRKGDPLVNLNDEQVKLDLKSAETAQRETELALAKLVLEAAKARTDVERILKYFDPLKPDESKTFRKEDYDIAVLAREKADNAVESGQFALQKAAAEVERKRVQLSYAQITAPVDGVIVERNVRENELVGENASLFKIADFSALEIKLDVPEAGIRGLREPRRIPAVGLLELGEKVDLDTAQAVFVSVTAYPSERFLGYLERVAPTIDPARGMIVATVRLIAPQVVSETTHAKLLAQLDAGSRAAVIATASRSRESGELRLRPGMWADARIVVDVRGERLTINGAAISGDSEVLWVIKKSPDGGSVARRVNIAGRRGLSSEEVFELAPLASPGPEDVDVADGDLVVVRGQSLLRDGQKVRVVELGK